MAVVILLVLPGCKVQQEALYVSPFNGNNEDYHPLPQRTDSVHTAVYVHGSYIAGAANDKGTDYFSGGRAGIFVAHHFGLFQCYYGVDLSLGTYHLGRWDTSYTFLPVAAQAIPPPTARQICLPRGEAAAPCQTAFAGPGDPIDQLEVGPATAGEARWLKAKCDGSG